jgi:hypothetical protein
MRPTRLCTGLGGLALIASLLVVTAAGTPAATTASSVTNILKSQRVEHAKLVGHSAYKPSATNLAEGVLRSGAPAAFTDDLNLVRSLTGATGPGTAPGSSSFPKAAAKGSVPQESSGSSNDSQDGAVQTAKGLNAHDLAVTHGFIAEPPDQGLCAGNGFVVEMVNLNLQVFNANLEALSGPMVLETFFNEGIAFGAAGGDVTIQGDPRCYWDANTQRWFLSNLVLDLSTNTAWFDIAVSTTSNPLGDFNVYSLDNTDNFNSFNPGCPCFGDQPTMGANHDAIFISTNEFSINNPVFNGAVLYTIDKQALAAGADSANAVADYIGLDVLTPSTPGLPQGSCVATHGLNCWASVRPTSSPTSGDQRFGGVEYLLSALDFANLHDNRIAVWALTNTSSINSDSPSVGLRVATLASESYVFPGFARQKAGTIPLGASGQYSCEPHTPCPTPTPQTEGPIQTNDDQIQSAVYASGLVWGGLNTTMPIVSKGKIGIAYFAVSPRLTSTGLTATIAKQGYIVAPGNDVEFPSIGVDSQGKGVVSFTLSGPRYYPSSAYATIDRSGAGNVKVAALGQSPQDGFTEYEFRNGPPPPPATGVFRPRWGDYSAAVAVGQTIYFATEYIQYPNCTLAEFKLDATCGGTRSRSANWGTAINRVDVSSSD